MGSITVLNGTNVPINTAISAGVNYSWCNRLWPKTYYQHEGGVGVYTLNARFWYGPDTEYDASGAEIGIFLGAMVLGVVGLVAAPITGGWSLTAGFLAASSGLALSGIGLGVKDFKSEPAKWTNIHAAQNRKFIVEGNAPVTIQSGQRHRRHLRRI